MAVGGNICFISATLQLLGRIPEFDLILSTATSPLGLGLHGIFCVMRCRHLREHDPELLSWVACDAHHGLLQAAPGSGIGVSADAAEFLVSLLERLGNLEGSAFAAKVQALCGQHYVQQLHCAKCGHTKYHASIEPFGFAPGGRRPDLPTHLFARPSQQELSFLVRESAPSLRACIACPPGGLGR
jgi:uncharacterized UBP type Zn finger protein